MSASNAVELYTLKSVILGGVLICSVCLFICGFLLPKIGKPAYKTYFIRVISAGVSAFGLCSCSFGYVWMLGRFTWYARVIFIIGIAVGLWFIIILFRYISSMLSKHKIGIPSAVLVDYRVRSVYYFSKKLSSYYIDGIDGTNKAFSFKLPKDVAESIIKSKRRKNPICISYTKGTNLLINAYYIR